MRTTLARITAWTFGVGICALAARAQLDGPPPIPAPRGDVGGSPAVWHYLLLGLLALATLGVSVLPSKRGHQD